MSLDKKVVAILENVLSLKGRSADFSRSTPLLGALPELDSMAVVGILTALEENFGFTVHDDEIDAASFATLGSLVDFVSRKAGVA